MTQPYSSLGFLHHRGFQAEIRRYRTAIVAAVGVEREGSFVHCLGSISRMASEDRLPRFEHRFRDEVTEDAKATIDRAIKAGYCPICGRTPQLPTPLLVAQA